MPPGVAVMPSHDARTIRGAAIPTAVAGVLATAISAAVVGGKGAIGAAFAAALVMVFFAAGQFALERLTRNNPQLMMGVALLVYTTQILLVGIVLAVFKDTTLFDTKVFAFTLLGCVFIWCGGQVRAHLKAKQYYVQTDDKPDEQSKPGRQQ
jgi:ATP synthase protein I